MHCLNRIDQHAGDIVPSAKHMQRALAHLGERVHLARRPRIAGTSLHAVPPSVIRAGEANDVRAASVVSRESNRLHHRFGARHVERHLVEPGDRAQPLDVLRHHRVIRPEHDAETLRSLDRPFHGVAVKLRAEEIDPVRPAQIVLPIPVEIADPRPACFGHDAAHGQCLLDQSAKLKWRAIRVDEIDVGHRALEPLARLERARRHVAKALPKLLEGLTTTGDDARRCVVQPERVADRVLIAWKQSRESKRDARMSRQ